MSQMTKIEFERRKAGLTQMELAKMVGITPLSVTLWENGKTKPSADNLLKLCAIFNKQLTDIVGYCD